MDGCDIIFKHFRSMPADTLTACCITYLELLVLHIHVAAQRACSQTGMKPETVWSVCLHKPLYVMRLEKFLL